MSGGSWDYFCWRLEEVAGRLQGESIPLRAAFGDHLELCAKALHDIEWVDSCDYGEGDELEAIRAVLGPGAELDKAVERAVEAKRDLEAALDRCPK